MNKRPSHTIKKKILLFIKSRSLTFAQLERKVNTGYRTIKTNCEELQEFGMVDVEKEVNPQNGRISNVVKITPRGLEYLERESV